jgi:hypothetical protein
MSICLLHLLLKVQHGKVNSWDQIGHSAKEDKKHTGRKNNGLVQGFIIAIVWNGSPVQGCVTCSNPICPDPGCPLLVLCQGNQRGKEEPQPGNQ